jgi:hypothetical protein
MINNTAHFDDDREGDELTHGVTAERIATLSLEKQLNFEHFARRMKSASFEQLYQMSCELFFSNMALEQAYRETFQKIIRVDFL